MERQQAIVDHFELVLRKMGHDPFGVYVTRNYIAHDGMRCRRCGYYRRIGLVDEEEIAPCLVEGVKEDVDTAPDQGAAPFGVWRQVA